MIPQDLTSIWNAIAPAASNHLWQSTLFAIMVAILTLAFKKNQARIRYRLWLAASLKFLLPFSLLISLGSHLARPHHSVSPQSGLYWTVEEFSQPFPEISAPASPLLPLHHVVSSGQSSSLLPEVLVAAWFCGFVSVLTLWVLRWQQVSAAIRGAAPISAGREVDALRRVERKLGMRKPTGFLQSRDSLEPGIFGIVRPVLLWPAAISEHLHDAHLEAILGHELWHVQRRDNLTAAIHMLVEAIFWFHPLVWWLGAQLVAERERACDEGVLHLGNRPQIYAEGILKTCEFCVGSPLPLVSGVTGADLKDRIVRIMTQRVALRLNLRKKLMLLVATAMAIALPISFGLVWGTPAHLTGVHAQAKAENPNQSIADTWQGTLHAGRDLRTVVKISKAGDGGYKALFYSIDQGGDGLPVTKITLDGATVKMSLAMVDGTYEGKLSSDGKTITGTWTQGPNPLPLVLTRATPETEWTIPPPEPKLPPMDANANPGFEVATIKPSAPNKPGKGFGFRAGHFQTMNTNLNDLMAFAYGLHAKQIIDAPAWFGTDLYDIEGKPDVEGRPSATQMQMMVQKLLADRFKLTFHHDKKELSVYVISVASGGPKMEKSTAAPNEPQAFFFRGLGDLIVRNQTMADFATWMQSGVMDKPVVDQTELKDRYDFKLKWTPDDSQFAQFRGTGAKVPTPPDDPNAPPGLYTAIQEQLGLKMGPAKFPDDVIVIDHIEKPSEN